MSHVLDRTGKVYACYTVIRAALGQPGHWLIECNVCGERYVKTTDQVRCAGNKRTKNCESCAPKSIPPQLRETTGGFDPGSVWDGKKYVSTALGLLQQQFYTGRLS